MGTIREVINNIHGLLLSLGQTIGPADIVDILIIAYLIYRVLIVLRKTSAGSVIKGILVIFIVAWLSYLFELQVMTFLLGQTLQMGIILIVILFQPELRKLFEQMGTSKLNITFRRRVKLEVMESAIANVVAAVSAMTKSKTGAIIIFERKVGLDDYAVSGTKIDALVTTELILNIFYHNSPLHDGAVLIREGRLLAAACMLPLSNNINLGRDLGMRHRAGIGITERSDAVVIVVSEQTGSISVAVDGMLKRHLDKDTFEKLLMNELIIGDAAGLTKKKTRDRKIRNGLSHD
jgi:diadenylate cyclase